MNFKKAVEKSTQKSIKTSYSPLMFLSAFLLFGNLFPIPIKKIKESRIGIESESIPRIENRKKFLESIWNRIGIGNFGIEIIGIGIGPKIWNRPFTELYHPNLTNQKQCLNH